MKGDFTRSTYDASKQYTQVRHQQGRVQVDADFNEQGDLQLSRERALATHVVGQSGAPKADAGFALSLLGSGEDIAFSPGHYYVSGRQCRIDATTQAAQAVGVGLIQVENLKPDGRPLAARQWIALTGAGGVTYTGRIVSVTQATRRIAVTPDIADIAPFAQASLRRLVTYATQPGLAQSDLIDAAQQNLNVPDGRYAAYLEVWERAVSPLGDPAMREVALGGADTSVRTQLVWQVRLRSVAADAPAPAPKAGDCCAIDGECPALEFPAPTGRLLARAQPDAVSDDPCILGATGGYRRLENQLYRVEIHRGNENGGDATFKWSRENGSVETRWSGQSGNDLQVSSTGRDSHLGFHPGDWIELFDETAELLHLPGTLVRIDAVKEGVLTIAPATADGSTTRADFPLNPRIRRWDMVGLGLGGRGERLVEVPVADEGFLSLESGVQIQFETGKTYRSGDYWILPARTATRDVEWPRDASQKPLWQAPQGIVRHQALLGTFTRTGGTLALHDCRELFPSLSALCASDICYQSGCDLTATNVQDALDALCRARDLRWHNKHLHGHGVVCGLQVFCPAETDLTRRSVRILSGYALDCEGNDLVLEEEASFPLLERVLAHDAQAAQADRWLDATGKGDVCLVVRKGTEGEPVFELRKYDKDSHSLKSRLDDTLLLKFYRECIEGVFKQIQEELTPGPNEANQPAGPKTQLMAALVNLAIQVVDPATGQYVFLSKREHDLLLRFYNRLKSILRDETFCGLYDEAAPFPAYPFSDLAIDTLFGKNHHVRLRARPLTREVYSFGPGLHPTAPSSLVNRYDAETMRLVERIDVNAGAVLAFDAPEPKASTGAVLDIGFSPDGKRIYVTWATRNGDDTLFRQGAFNAKGAISWGPVTNLCGVRMVTLATTEADASAVYAVGQKTVTTNGKSTLLGTGLYRIKPEQPDADPKVLIAFNSAGHLVIAKDGSAFMTAQTGPTTEPKRYNRIRAVTLPLSDNSNPDDINLTDPGEDDIAILPQPTGDGHLVFHVGITQNGKELESYDYPPRRRNVAKLAQLPSTHVRLATLTSRGANVPGRVFVSLEESFTVHMATVTRSGADWQSEYALPTQVSPVAMASHEGEDETLFILNQGSNTITVASGNTLGSRFRFDFDALRAYREQALKAYIDLLAGFLQYLKDCLCEHFLLECPSCGQDDAIELACISIRNNKAYKICNFAGRKYVKSFPAVDWWMSLVPVMPVMRHFLGEFCCMLLPNLFGKVKTTAPARAPNTFGKAKVTSAPARTFSSAGQALNFNSIKSLIGNKFTLFNGAVKSSGASQAVDNLNRSAEVDAAVLNQPTTRATATLEKKGIKVRTAAFDATEAASAPKFTALLRQPNANEELVLHEKDGRVAYYTIENKAASAATAVPGATSGTDGGKDVVTTPAVTLAEFQSLKDAVAVRDKEIAELRLSVQTQNLQLQNVAVLSNRLQLLEGALVQLRPQGGLVVNTNAPAVGAERDVAVSPQNTLILLGDAAKTASPAPAAPIETPAKAASTKAEKTTTAAAKKAATKTNTSKTKGRTK
jgi:Family of unknown function (DUF6519)